MKNLNTPLFVSVVLLLFVNSCTKSSCVNPGIQVNFSGFDTVLLTKVIVEQYKINSNYATLVNVSVRDTSDTLTQIHQSNDTIYVPISAPTQAIDIAPGFDYKIILPFARRTFKISNISYHTVSRRFSDKGRSGCTNDASYYIDSIPLASAGTVFDTAYPPPVHIVLKK